ncbi:MAG: glycine oxidase ThiO [Chloroflexi bacterium]|nr:glycine oxidase ThiO [Chloroflexota bacterium]
MKSSDAIVIGGGVIGCSIAYYLSKAGIKVTLLERGQIGMEASNAASGVLSTPLFKSGDPYSRMSVESLGMFPDLQQELQETCGVDIEFARCGELGLAMAEDEAGEYQDLAMKVAEAGGNARWMDFDSLHDYEPQVGPEILGGFYMPEVCRVNNQRLSLAFARSAEWHGARVLQSTEVVGLVRSGLQITGVRLSDDEVYADNIIMAAGPWTRALAEGVGGDIPVRPVRGLNLNLQPVGRSFRSVIHGSLGMLVPRADGSVIAGVTVEEAGFDCRVTAGAVQEILAIVTSLVPSLRDAKLNWALAGLRPGSPDDAPMMGPVPGWDGLLVATGHYRNGILLSPITGKLIADYVAGKEPELIEHFSLRRFRE